MLTSSQTCSGFVLWVFFASVGLQSCEESHTEPTSDEVSETETLQELRREQEEEERRWTEYVSRTEGLDEDPRTIPGVYYNGDGLGFNHMLYLRSGRDFECSWWGCLGFYGSLTGTWERRDETIAFELKEATGTFEDREFADMRIQMRGEQILLVPVDDLDRVEQLTKEFDVAFAEDVYGYVPFEQTD